MSAPPAAPGLRGLFVTGTDTGAGKTVVAGAIAAVLADHGRDVAVCKPVVTGLDEPADPGWPHDHVLLAGAVGDDPAAVALATFGPAVSPHLAVQLEAAPSLTLDLMVSHVLRRTRGGRFAIVEGVGGLLVPLARDVLVRDLAVALGLPLVVAARPGLGTINHTLLTLEVARAAGLDVRAVVLTPWPEAPGPLERSNAETIAALGAVAVETLPALADGTRASLRNGGRALRRAAELSS